MTSNSAVKSSSINREPATLFHFNVHLYKTAIVGLNRSNELAAATRPSIISAERMTQQH